MKVLYLVDTDEVYVVGNVAWEGVVDGVWAVGWREEVWAAICGE